VCPWDELLISKTYSTKVQPGHKEETNETQKKKERKKRKKLKYVLLNSSAIYIYGTDF
jgi:hypothetical protein